MVSTKPSHVVRRAVLYATTGKVDDALTGGEVNTTPFKDLDAERLLWRNLVLPLVGIVLGRSPVLGGP